MVMASVIAALLRQGGLFRGGPSSVLLGLGLCQRETWLISSSVSKKFTSASHFPPQVSLDGSVAILPVLVTGWPSVADLFYFLYLICSSAQH